jgi:hypothetical protein
VSDNLASATAAVEDGAAAVLVRPGGAEVAGGGHPPTPGPSPPTERDIAGWLGLLIDPGRDVELRYGPPMRGKRFRAGYLRAMIREALGHSGKVPGVYFTLNPVSLPLRAGGKLTGDEDILCRRRLLIDCDPRRDPAALEAARERARAEGRDFNGISATDDEKAAALGTAAEIRAHLKGRGWPEPIVADSGNGGHLVYAIDLPNDVASLNLVKGVLQALARRFESPAVEIDTAVCNASRITKLYGTMACKGPDTAERPHRASRVLAAPESLRDVPRGLLEAIAAEAARPAEASPPPPASAPAKRRATRQAKAPQGTTIRPGDRLARARMYLDRCEPAVQGEKGSWKTIKVACKVGPGFDLSPDQAFALLRDVYSPRCQPPWPDAQLRHKVDDSYKLESRRGFLLDAPRSRVGRTGNGRAHADDDGALGPPPDGGRRGDGPGDDLPVITITTKEHRIIDQAVEALAVDPNVYQRGNMLMTVLRDVVPKNRVILRPPGSPRVSPLPTPRLRELLTKWAVWEKVRKTRDGDDETVEAHPPEWAVAGIAARGCWPEIRPIESVTETPALRLDGTILDQAGYDERTALLFEPNAAFPPIPAAPTQADARRAAETLLRLVVDFPFAGEDHRAAWLAALLTPLARFAIAGPCPLFLIDANTPGTGKSKLTDVVAIVSMGRGMPRTTYPDTDDEMRKRISSIALAGDRLMLLDNIATTFGGSALDSALTAMTWRDRILGRSEMTAELPLFTVWYATGNNVALRGDVLRRIVPCRLETREERPEERREFTIEGDLLEYVQRERPRLVAAALTLLRAHAVAGRPDGGLNLLGSFEAWSRVVRSAVYWAIGRDPCRTREELRAADPEVLARVALIEGWAELLVIQKEEGLTAAAALKLVKETPSGFDKLRDVFMEWSRKDDLPSARSVGMRLKALKGRVINGKFFSSTEDRGTQIWRVEEVTSPE